MKLLLLSAAGVLLLGAITYVLYGSLLHPAWRRERRLRRACEKAFGETGYRLVRLRLRVDDPSGADLFAALPFSSSEVPRYFTYCIEAERDPSVSGMRRHEIGIVQHYLDRTVSSPHHGREVIHSGPSAPERSEPTPDVREET